MKTVIVTGATGGIGQAIVDALYASGGYHIIATGRSQDKLERLVNAMNAAHGVCGSEIETIVMDLSSFASVMNAALLLQSRHIDAVINNAGQMPLRTTRITADGFEQTLQVNCISSLLFTQLLVPSLVDGAAVVFTTSVTRGLPRVRIDFDECSRRADTPVKRFVNYGRSKQLLALYAAYMSQRLTHRKISVNCADPGVVDSGIIALGYPVVDWLADKCFRPFISSPSTGAKAALAAMNANGGDSLIYRHSGKAVAFHPHGPVQETVQRLDDIVGGLLI